EGKTTWERLPTSPRRSTSRALVWDHSCDFAQATNSLKRVLGLTCAGGPTRSGGPFADEAWPWSLGTLMASSRSGCSPQGLASSFGCVTGKRERFLKSYHWAIDIDDNNIWEGRLSIGLDVRASTAGSAPRPTWPSLLAERHTNDGIGENPNPLSPCPKYWRSQKLLKSTKNIRSTPRWTPACTDAAHCGLKQAKTASTDDAWTQ
ncbi:MAG: hypothetical protein ACJATT_005428, partial [Myxococcota bacterium]